MGNKVHISFIDYETVTYSPDSTPEKSLLAAMLERAIRDISFGAERDITKQALKWFGHYGKEKEFTYHFIADTLNLSWVDRATVVRKVKKALDYLETGIDTREKMNPGRLRISSK